jgi:hypothetical protein
MMVAAPRRPVAGAELEKVRNQNAQVIGREVRIKLF